MRFKEVSVHRKTSFKWSYEQSQGRPICYGGLLTLYQKASKKVATLHLLDTWLNKSKDSAVQPAQIEPTYSTDLTQSTLATQFRSNSTLRYRY